MKPVLAVSFVSLTLSVAAQSLPQDTARPTFDAVSVRQNKTDGGMFIQSVPGRFTATGVPVELLLITAYNVRPENIYNAPGWTRSEKYDVLGTLANAKPIPRDDLRVLLQGLLAERFKLRVKEAAADTDGFRLVLDGADGRLGTRLTVSNVKCDEGGPAAQRPGPPTDALPSQAQRTTPCFVRSDKPGNLVGRGAQISRLTTFLSTSVRTVISDGTGLSDRYDFDLTWLPEPRPGSSTAAPSPAATPDAPSIFTAVKEQLGLKLVPEKIGQSAIIVESIERQREN